MDTKEPVKLYVVAGTSGGFAREDAAVPSVAGAFTDEELAKKVASVTHGQVITVELDVIKPGILESLKAFGFKIPGAGQD